MAKKERGIHELFAADPERAERELWNRKAHSQSRRGFVTGLGVMSAALGANIVFSDFIPSGLIPAAFANSIDDFLIEGKNGLRVLNDRPLNAETPVHLLNDDVTPSERLFIRNNGIPPQNVDASDWTLTVEGESVRNSKTYTLNQLKRRFEHVSQQLLLECGGNGRAEFDPPVSGNQWTLGAVGCPYWDGIRLVDVLQDCGVKEDAVYVAYYGKDVHLSGDVTRVPISRGVPVGKAIEQESLIAWGMNGHPLHPMNGYPLRLIFGGWPGSVSGKWLSRISIRNRVHDGPKMASPSYRIPCTPVRPGSDVPDTNMCIIESMPVKSLVTYPHNSFRHSLENSLPLHGHAWAGDLEVKEVHISIDFGATWERARLNAPANRLAWQNWDHSVKFPQRGYYEVWARAVDQNGHSQPMVLPNWNPKGYLNNSCHRIAVYSV